MAENITSLPEATEPVVEETNRFKNFVTKHPRTVKVAAAATAVAGLVGVVALVKKNSSEFDPTFDYDAQPASSGTDVPPSDATSATEA